MADVAHEENVIEGDERTFIHSIIDFGDTVAREVMTPRPDMVTVEGRRHRPRRAGGGAGAGYSRIPVEADGIDDIIGIAYAKDLVRAERVGKAEQPVRDSMRPAKFIPESKEVSDLLREMQEEKFHMAIVVDEYGGTAGSSRWRTSSRSWSATSSTSSTSRSRRSSASTTARSW